MCLSLFVCLFVICLTGCLQIAEIKHFESKDNSKELLIQYEKENEELKNKLNEMKNKIHTRETLLRDGHFLTFSSLLTSLLTHSLHRNCQESNRFNHTNQIKKLNQEKIRSLVSNNLGREI